MRLLLPGLVAAAVDAHAREAYPEECCGLLIGRVPEDFGAPGCALVVAEARPLANGWEGAARARRYAIDPAELARVERDLAGTGRGVVGVYHSHPDVAAWPSPFDLDHAWPSVAYLIVSVRERRVVDARVWRRSEDGRAFEEGAIELVQESPMDAKEALCP